MAKTTKTTASAATGVSENFAAEAKDVALIAMREAVKGTYVDAMRKFSRKTALYQGGIEHANRVIEERAEKLAEGGELEQVRDAIIEGYFNGDERAIAKAVAKLDKIKVVGTELPDSLNPFKG